MIALNSARLERMQRRLRQLRTLYLGRPELLRNLMALVALLSIGFV